ncbi:MAG: SUMF1/EgtB/PvdO family nonheme iron enzyme, partial [Mariniphaga sp.]
HERLEQKKLQEEKAEQERLAAQKAKDERIEIENQDKLLVDKQLKEIQQKAKQERLELQKLEEEKVEQQRLAAQKADEEPSIPVLNQQPTSAETHRSLQDPAASLRTMNPKRKKLIYLLSSFVVIVLVFTAIYFYLNTTGIIQTPVETEQNIVPAEDTRTKNVEPKKTESTVNQEVKKAEKKPIFDPKDKLIQAVNAPTNDSAFPQMVLVKGGEFMMGDDNGSDNEKPAHKVVVSDFYIGKYEVTQKEWTDIMGTNPSSFKGCDNCPVEQVSWLDIQEFLKKLNQRTGKTYRLPTEAEWEFACRAGTTNPFNTGNNLTTSQANYNGNYPYNNNPKGIYREKTMPVGSFAPNALGLCDMHGNVWEWCSDLYDEYYYAKPLNDNHKESFAGYRRVIRGGAWNSYAQDCRAANRDNTSPGNPYYAVGFRLVSDP